MTRGGKRRAQSPPPKTRNAKRTKISTITVYDRNFEQRLVDHGIYFDDYEYPDGQMPERPNNWKDINERLTRPRASLSPTRFTNDDFRKFKRAETHASKEALIMTSVIPVIEGGCDDIKCSGGDYTFGNLAPLITLGPNSSGTKVELAKAKPDLLYGARFEQLNPQIRDELNDLIIPSTQDTLPMLPNSFLEAKGPDGTAAVVNRQVCYDGALGARGMRALQTYKRDKTVYDNKAHTITSTYLAGQLKLYTHHIVPSRMEGRDSEYVMNQLKGYAMTSDRETFVQGASAYRNLWDWAKEQRNELIKDANERLRSQPASGRGEVFGSPSSADDARISTEPDFEPNSESEDRELYDSASNFAEVTIRNVTSLQHTDDKTTQSLEA